MLDASRPAVTVTARGEQRLREGHVWIYRSDVTDPKAMAGDLVSVVSPKGRVLGDALYSDRSTIAVRMLTRGDLPADTAWWRARLESAIAYRNSLHIDATALRLVHGEGDQLPSLVVDRYGDYLVVQALSQGIDRRLPELCGMLVERLSPMGVLARNDAQVRRLEGLERRVDVLFGSVPETVTVREGDVQYEVDPWKGQKTGLFLDQRENREAARQYARGRLLDCFSYTGGFALRLAARADEVVAIDASADAIATLSRNAQRNGFTHIRAQVGNAFDVLRELERRGERFDTIVLDPPAFAKNRAAVAKARPGYKEINLRALKLLVPGGYLVTCSCSYHISEAAFGEIVYAAVSDARATVVLVDKRMQGRDHPVLLGVPETYYLKCFILRKLI